MAILAFQKPEKVIMLESNSFRGKFEFRPLEPGYGITVGNALRRILLSSLEGYAITSIKIEGIDHEFSTISGVIDDVTNIILNLKYRLQVLNLPNIRRNFNVVDNIGVGTRFDRHYITIIEHHSRRSCDKGRSSAKTYDT